MNAAWVRRFWSERAGAASRVTGVTCRSGVPGLARLDRPAVRLPPRRSSFVGRTADLGEIAARLTRHAVVTLTGVGGVGKTALAVEAAWIEVAAGRAELACFADLVPCRTDEQVIA